MVKGIAKGIAKDMTKGIMNQKEQPKGVWEYILNHVKALNDSKIFAGMMIIIINIASKFVTFKVSKTMESYLKFNFSRDVLVFAITWMGTRDIFIALGMTLLFVFIADYLFNEDSMLCCLPKSVVSQQVAKLNEPAKKPTSEEVIKAKIILEKAGEGVKSGDTLADAQMNPGAYRESFTIMG
jgi:hypothetical protein